MGRGRYGMTFPAANSDQRQSLGDQHVQTACTDLNKLCQRTVAELTHYEPTREATLPMLFRDDDLEKLKQVRGMVEPSSYTCGYTVGTDTIMFINFEGAQVPTIMKARLQVNTTRCQPLEKFIRDVRAIHNRFEEVKGLLRWLNRNATPGAIRYYFPAVMKLCPASPALADLTHVPARYSQPPHIGDWADVIRMAAATVAGSALLPDSAKPRDKGNMWLTIGQVNVRHTIEARYQTDEMTYNL